MNDKFDLKPKNNSVVRLVGMAISFFVGLSAFFVLRLIIIAISNLMATPTNVGTVQSLGSIFLILSIGIAAVYTKILNSSNPAENRNKKRIITVILGVICFCVSIVILHAPIY